MNINKGHELLKRNAELEKELTAKNRELEIESALERVRTTAMAMKEPSDMLQVCRMISDQLLQLGFKEIRNVQTVIIYPQKHEYLNYQYFTLYDKDSIETIDYRLHPDVLDFTNRMLASADAYYTKTFEGKELEDWREYRKQTNQLPDPKLDETNSSHYYFYSIGSGALGITTYAPLSSGQIDLFKRFRNVFELAYRRFIDIEKAQAQAREAQIQLALERVRARAMAMHHSEELSEVVKLLYQEFDKLKINNESTDIEIGLIDEETGIASIWAHFYLSDGAISTFKFPFTHFGEINEEFIKWKATPVEKRNELFFTTEFSEKQWQRFMSIAEKLPELAEIFRPLLEAKITKWVTHNAYFSHGILTLQGTEAYSKETQEIQKRFAKVFEQTYTRFLDLKKAEAQTREAQIETGLERVRSKTMAMHKSDEVTGIAVSLNEELLKLGFEGGSTIIIINRETGDTKQWAGFSEDKSIKSCDVPYFKHPCHDALLDSWKKDESYLVYTVTGDEKRSFDEHYFTTGYKIFPESDKKWMREMGSVTFSHAFMKYGAIHWGPDHLTEEQLRILQRFSKVFEQSYTRFLDLQKAEAQAREAQIEAALERVRAKVMAMTNSKELNATSLVFGEQLRKLGIDWQFSYFWLVDESKNENVFWITWPDYKTSFTSYTMAEAEEYFNDCLVSWRAGVKIHDNYVPPEGVQAWLDTFQRIADDAGGEAKKVMVPQTFANGVFYYDAMMKYGSFGICIGQPATDEEKNIQCRFAIEFERAYTRFLDLKKAEAHAEQARLDLIQIQHEKKRAEEALAELQATQKQLIQSEKMASLGELTAGIAHEIQNPLNFVNNFSDVSNELLEEMRSELATGNMQSAIEIANDVKRNLEKILHHGKRADAIVKGMLQHSRTSSGQKELTDINTLADEYLRLAYHGLRAKDKFFNAKFETEFDPSISKVNVVPQEIGRVILNLINNSFYAVSEKKKSTGNGYEPTVIVSTKKVSDRIEIKVKDNGNGIPQKALDKIFQPFFTTKPTGQGTGLGLSLSYDIITKGHDGEIKVETKEGEGSAFTITLPMN